MKQLVQRGAALATFAALVAVIAGTASAGPAYYDLQPLDPEPLAESGGLVNETPKFWFVEFPTAPTSEGGRDADVDGDRNKFRSEAQAEGVSYRERLRFRELWNGVSVEAKASAISKIRKFASVKAVFPIRTHKLPPTTEVSPDLATAITMTGADIVQSELGFTGRGIKVAVMDTGIDWQHPDLGAGFGAGHRVRKGFDFVGDAYNADPNDPAYNPNPVPDPNPDDCNGHGTHVAGIVGANGEVKGVAPDVTFGAYRVFGCEGSTTDDIMLAAMERVNRDDMDILNMSIGDAFNNWPGTPTAAGASRLAKKGVVVVASIGNSGTSGLYAAGAPGVGERVIGVASYDNIQVTLNTFTITPDGLAIGYTNAAAAPTAPTSGSSPMSRTGTQTTTNDGCNPLPAGSLTGTVALVRRGTCGFYFKALNAMNAGAIGVVIYNNVPGHPGGITVDPVVAGAPPGSPSITIPVVAISGTQGNTIDTRLASGPVTMTWTAETAGFPNATGNLISGFSSYGIAADLTLKPDIGAPGGFIFSTIPLEQGGHGNNSGTSMASPHVAGAVALLLDSWERNHDERRGKGDRRGDDNDNRGRVEDVRDILQNVADPKVWSGNPGLGFLEPSFRQGAGMLDIDDAILSTALVTPGKLSLGEGTGPVTKRLRIKNNSRWTQTFTLSHVASIGTGPSTYPPLSFNLPDTTVTFSSPTVTLGRNDRRSVDVTITPDATLPDNSLYGGYIVLTPSTGGDPIRVPYAGFKGDYQSIQIMTGVVAGNPLPWLARILPNGTIQQVPAGTTFTLFSPDQQPNAVVHLNHQARRLTLSVVRNSDGRTLGRAIELEYLARNSTAGGVFAFAWDGTYLSGERGRRIREAPDGAYKLVLTVEKALAERNNPAHVESWTSPVFNIDRP